MTDDQLQLVDVAAVPKLTDRQARALELLTAAGHDGLHADELGAIVHEEKGDKWAHSRDIRYVYCGSTGNELLNALRNKGLAKYRRAKNGIPGAWIAIKLAEGATPTPRGDAEDIPF